MTITDVAGIRVGHWTEPVARTGCTVVLLPAEGAVAGVDVRGSAPGTRETDLLRPGMLIERVHAICLSGGSAFGLGAADGVMRYLRERGIGVDVGRARVPIVPAAVIFDLGTGAADVFPGPDAGYAACADAERGPGAVLEGAVGAGTGASIGKLLGRDAASPGGVGSAAVRLPGGAVVGALVVANGVGDVHGRDGRLLAGARGADGELVGAASRLLAGAPPTSGPVVGGNTTIGVVATDAALDKAGCRKLAERAQDGLALAIRPAHTMFDGDTIFAVSTGTAAADMTSLGVAVVEAVWQAMERAVTSV